MRYESDSWGFSLVAEDRKRWSNHHKICEAQWNTLLQTFGRVHKFCNKTRNNDMERSQTYVDQPIHGTRHIASCLEYPGVEGANNSGWCDKHFTKCNARVQQSLTRHAACGWRFFWLYLILFVSPMGALINAVVGLHYLEALDKTEIPTGWEWQATNFCLKGRCCNQSAQYRKAREPVKS